MSKAKVTSKKMRCLSVRQPWAWAIVAGLKDIENRSWSTEYRGPIVVHASANRTGASGLLKSAKANLPPLPFDYSALVGVVDVLEVEPLSPELEGNPWALGPFCWRLANPRRFKEPLPAMGKLNLYALPDELAQDVVRALPDAEPGRRDRRLDAWANHLVGGIPEVVRLTDLYQSYIFLEDPDNALRLAERCVMLQGSADAYVNRAVAKALLAEPDYKGAILDLDKGVATDPTFGRAYYVRAMIHREEGRVDQAAADSAKAKELGFDEEGGGGDPNDASE